MVYLPGPLDLDPSAMVVVKQRSMQDGRSTVGSRLDLSCGASERMA